MHWCITSWSILS